MFPSKWQRIGFSLGVMLTLGACGGGGGSDTSIPPPCAAATKTCYVRVSGKDTNSGADPANALRTISKAAQLARRGYRIIVGPGTYPGDVLSTAGVGVAPQGLQFIANVAGDQTGDPAGEVKLVAAGTATAGFNLASTPGGTLIDGFTISGFKDAGIVIKSGSDDLTIRNCIVLDNTGDGIRVQDSASVLIFNNLIHDNGGVGVGIVGQISGSPDAMVVSNTIVGNGARGITVGNTKAASPRATVQNNIVQDNQGDANIKVFTLPRSDEKYDGNYNLVFPGTYLGVNVGAHDLNVDAQFKGGGDFHLNATSPAINSGFVNLPNSETTILRGRTTTGAGTDLGSFDRGFHFLR